MGGIAPQEPAHTRQALVRREALDAMDPTEGVGEPGRISKDESNRVADADLRSTQDAWVGAVLRAAKGEARGRNPLKLDVRFSLIFCVDALDAVDPAIKVEESDRASGDETD